MKIERAKRRFIDENLVVNSWNDIKQYFDNLIERKIESIDDFQQLLSDKSELDAVLEEDAAWRYIKMSINTKDQHLVDSYTLFVSKIQPEIAPFEDLINKKIVSSPFFKSFETSTSHQIYFKSIQTALDLFNEENIPLEAELAELAQKYGAITAAQTINYQGEEITMQKAAMFLKELDENVRKDVFVKISERRKTDIDQLNNLFNEMVQKRQQVAANAGFENFRDYKFKALGRYDYTKEDCFDFHSSIKSLIVPLVKEIQEKKLSKLGKTQFKPWDLDVDPEGKAPLKPFKNGKELLEKTVSIFNRLDPYFGDCISTMNEMGHLDLESKNGKAPGGYNYPLYEIGVPFIFMNAVGSQRDLVTMVHEGGHAVHSFLSRNLTLTAFKNLPSEVAELASMSMELLSMKHWNEFYQNEENYNRAVNEQLEGIIKVLPWIAQIDEFQHWIYENPNHNTNERTQKWMELNKEYGTGLTDWTDFIEVQANSWHRQLHLFEVPFYYIEYGIAQLGALAVWKNSLENEEKAIQAYKEALKLGYSKTIPEIYQTANIQFNFSAEYIKSISEFIQNQLNKS